VFETVALMQGSSWQGGGLQPFLQGQPEKKNFVPFLLLQGSSASADWRSPHQLPAVGAGHRQNRAHLAAAPARMQKCRSQDTFSAVGSRSQAWLAARTPLCQGTCRHCSTDVFKPSHREILELL